MAAVDSLVTIVVLGDETDDVESDGVVVVLSVESIPRSKGRIVVTSTAFVTIAVVADVVVVVVVVVVVIGDI